MDIEKFETLRLYTKDLLAGEEANILFKKTILHSLIIGYTINFENLRIDKFQKEMPQFVKFFEKNSEDDEYSQDFAYLIFLIISKVKFREKKVLS